MTGILLTLSALAFTNIGLGWYLGYRSIPAYLAFWLMGGLILAAAVRLARAGGARGCADTVLRTSVLAFGAVVLAGLVLGALGLLSLASYVAFFTAFYLACLVSVRGLRVGERSRPDLPSPLAAAVLVPLVAIILAVGTLQSPLTLYDSLSYHLFFPARWLIDHRLSIIPTPFSDPAQAYQPAHGELFFLWLMAPFHGDLVARVGQLPFFLLGGVAIYALARRIGADRDHAVFAALLYLVARPIVEQAVGADVDLICAAMFLTSLYLGIAAVDSNDRRDWLLWGVSLGLFVGSKYLALIYSPVLLVLPFIKGVRPKALWAIPGIAALGLPWYLRNWLIAGSPIYPASLQLAGIVVARGAFTRAAMNNTVFHITDVRLLFPVVTHAFGAPLFIVWLPLAIVGAVWVLRRRPWWPGAYVTVAPIVMVVLFWFGLPVNIDSRFLIPAVGVAAVPPAFAFGNGSRLWMTITCVVGLAWILVGLESDIQVALPWYMSGWLTLHGLVNRPYVALFVVVGVAGFLVWQRADRIREYRPPIMIALVGVAAIGLARGSDVWCGPRRCDLLDLSSPRIRPTLLDSWEFVRTRIHGATLAYTGNNVPYPLFGDQLSNRVYYVSIDRHQDWRLHDYVRVRRKAGAIPLSTALARPSGELMPVREHAGPYEDASRPRYERMEGYREAWIQNLRALGVDHVFISSLSAYEIDSVWHDGDGFPIEELWAKADPNAFQLLYGNETVRVYAVDPARANAPPVARNR